MARGAAWHPLFRRWIMIVHMTRRDLAKIAVGTAALLERRPARAAATTKYTGALDGFEDKVDAAGFDPVRTPRNSTTRRRCA